MKRKRFMGGASERALLRKEITDTEMAKHKALSRLSDEFRESITWSGPEVPVDRDDGEVQMLRMPNDEPNPTDGASLVFADRMTYRGKPEEISQEWMARFWELCLDHIRPLTLDFCKAGAVIWDDLDFKVPPECTTRLLGLKQADAAITRAHQAALLNVFVSSVGPTDLEAINAAIAAFVHACPAFHHLTEEGAWHKPFGNRTAYRLVRQRQKFRRNRKR